MNSSIKCGTTIYKWDNQASVKAIKTECKDFRNCERCRSRWIRLWADYFRLRSLKKIHAYIIESSEAAKKRVHRATRSRIIFPQAEGKAIVLSEESDLLGMEPVWKCSQSNMYGKMESILRSYTDKLQSRISGDVYGLDSHHNTLNRSRKEWESLGRPSTGKAKKSFRIEIKRPSIKSCPEFRNAVSRINDSLRKKFGDLSLSPDLSYSDNIQIIHKIKEKIAQWRDKLQEFGVEFIEVSTTLCLDLLALKAKSLDEEIAIEATIRSQRPVPI